MDIQTILINCVKTKLADRLKGCDLSCIPYSIIASGLNQLGYTLSESKTYEDDIMDTNGWEYDYRMYIWKDGKYTGYCLYGSLYYGDNKIKK